MKTQTGHTGWDILYDFLDDILASIMPGAYFISYFVLWAIFFFNNDILTDLGGSTLCLLFLIVFCYCIGTIFRRSNMKKIDQKSGFYIYKNQNKYSNSFAFGGNITTEVLKLIDHHYKTLITMDIFRDAGELSLKNLKNDIDEEPPDKIGDRLIMFLFHYRKSVYGKLHRYYKKLLKQSEKQKHQFKNSQNFLLELQKLVYPKVDYPYIRFRTYLEERELQNLAKYVTWGEESGNPKARSKMKTNTYKVEIAAKASGMLSIINKNEAHIRFMNSMWYASEALLYCVLPMGIISAILSTFIQDGKLELYSTLFNFNHLIIIATVSLLYFIAALFVRHCIKRIIHYQRVRELVFLLTAYSEIA